MRRCPRFHSYDDVLGDAETSLANGYERVGSWSLGQVCSHLAMTMEKSLDGFPGPRMAWPMRTAARWFVLGRLLKHKQLGRRFPAPTYLMPAESQDDRAGVEHLRSVINRLNARSGELQFHPVFGTLTRQQWQDFHLWHCEHHFSFLLSKAPATSSK